ncbi:MAG TPA: NAD-dependent epimerase/dehydratase family protein [Fimbriimonas sp.]|nr:NAD-dependent epimerase/dehydratase family protein [Fimbriimonas sp.]
MLNPLAKDLDSVLRQTAPLWHELRGGRLFISGGTGYFGCWLLETFLWANDRLELGAEVTVLGRDFSKFLAKAPHLATHPAVHFIQGDVRSFRFPSGQFTHVIHAATDSTAPADANDTVDVAVIGTRRMLKFAAKCGAKRFLFTSSGAVYGPQPASVDQIPEWFEGEPSTAYGEGKRTAEELCLSYAAKHGFDVTIARGFAFIGPYLPIDAHFAAGNFIRDALEGGPIQVNGDGTPLRSYLYASDLATWMWTILFRGQSRRAYNVGSEEAISIAELAHCIKEFCVPDASVRVGKAAKNIQRYVPSTLLARTELGLRQTVSLGDAIRRTYHYHLRATHRDERQEEITWQKSRSETRTSAMAGRVSS